MAKNTSNKYSEIIINFSDKTSLNGFPFIKESKHQSIRMFWISLFLLASGFMFYHLLYLMKNYYSYTISTKLSLGFSTLQFPVVTFCNQNPVKKSMLAKTSMLNLYNVINNLEKHDSIRDKVTTPYFVQSTTNSELDLYDYDSDEKPSRSDSFKVYKEFLYYFSFLDKKTRINIGHHIDDMLLSCSYDGHICSSKDFMVFPSLEYGNCYSLNATNLLSKRIGPLYGLHLIFFTENSEFLPIFSTQYGMQIEISPPGIFPFPKDQGQTISAAFQTNIGIKMINISRLGRPYGSCADSEHFKHVYSVEYSRATCTYQGVFVDATLNISDAKAAFEIDTTSFGKTHAVAEQTVNRDGKICMWDEDDIRFYNCHTLTDVQKQKDDCVRCGKAVWQYCSQICENLCEMKLIEEKCGCYERSKKELRLLKQDDHKPCGHKEFKCMFNVKKKYAEQELACSCDNPCTETTYIKSISGASWPTPMVLDKLIQKVCKRKGTQICNKLKNATKRDQRLNFLSVNIYYENLNYETITEVPSYELVQFISDIGGTLGLWIGMSAITIFEIAELFLYSIWHFLTKCYRKNKIDTQ